MRSGADSEMTSGLEGADVDIIKQAPGIRREAGPAGVGRALRHHRPAQEERRRSRRQRPDARHRAGGRCRCATKCRSSQGRMFQFGTNEVIVGRGGQRTVHEPEASATTIVSGQNRWQVVGIFEADGGVAETEIWCDARTLQGAYRRGNTYQSVLAQLDSTDSFDAFRDWLTSNPQVNVAIRRENEYYAAQSVAMTRLIRAIGFGIAALMGIGAVFGAILTMYTAVATRAREIATLRALGFNTVGPGLGARRIAGARRDRRCHRRRRRLSRDSTATRPRR